MFMSGLLELYLHKILFLSILFFEVCVEDIICKIEIKAF